MRRAETSVVRSAARSRSSTLPVDLPPSHCSTCQIGSVTAAQQPAAVPLDPSSPTAVRHGCSNGERERRERTS